MEIQARAKINWSLDVVGRRTDGYHLLDGVMQPLTLSDTLILEKAEGLSLAIAESPGALSNGEDNLILKAALALKQLFSNSAGARITLIKRIPMGAGLGGGSADCAAALKGLNALWKLQLVLPALLEIGVRLGADVPFCLLDAPSRAQGIGEKLTPIPCGRTFPLVLIQPCEALSTPEVFSAYHHQAGMAAPDTEGVIRALGNGDLKALALCARNVLEGASIPLRPPLRLAKEDLFSSGAVMAQMTGSGSVVFGAFETMEAAAAAQEKLKKKYAVCLLTETAC